MTVAVILAAGTGTRVGSETAKQLLPLGAKTVLDHAVAAFHLDGIDDVLVVAPPGQRDVYDAALDRTTYPKVTGVVAGGASRTASTLQALAALGPDDTTVLFHDAARPLVPLDVVRSCLHALRTEVAVGVAVPCDDTVVEAEGDTVVDVLDRRRLRLMQTPQGFRLSVLRSAYAAMPADAEVTDNCGVVHRYLPDVRVHLVPGSPRNLKITRAEDLAVAEALLGRQP